VDAPWDATGLPAQVTRHKVRRSSGRIDLEDALSQTEVDAALAAGRAIADEEVDGGADLLIAGDMGIGNTTPASVLVAALTGAEPVAVVGRGTGVDDAGWMRKAAAVRDALRRARSARHDPLALLRTVAGADLAALAGFLAQSAARRTPVLLDGLVVGAAALVAEQLAPGASAWWLAGHRSVEPAHTLLLEHLGLQPLLDLQMRLGEGSGALAALPLVVMAGRILAEMATFAEAGVSNRPRGAADQPTDAGQAAGGTDPARPTGVEEAEASMPVDSVAAAPRTRQPAPSDPKQPGGGGTASPILPDTGTAERVSG
jgi:nicotinate-nucleotide--dimethylbenzimidazole phosphoribosyltransferase